MPRRYLGLLPVDHVAEEEDDEQSAETQDVGHQNGVAARSQPE